MSLKHMNCQSCGANLELDLDHLTASCPYCGEKLLIDMENLSDVLVAKEETKQKEIEHRHETEVRESDAQTEKGNSKKGLFVVLGVFIIAFLILFLLLKILL